MSKYRVPVTFEVEADSQDDAYSVVDRMLDQYEGYVDMEVWRGVDPVDVQEE